jgi:HEAT repeat protein
VAINVAFRDEDFVFSDAELFVMIETLRQLGHPEAFHPLLTLMAAEDLWSRCDPYDRTPYGELRTRARAAILSLGRGTLLQCEFYEALEKSRCYQLAALDIIGEFDDGSLAADLELGSFAEYEDPAVRQAAAEALEKIASRAAKNDAADR